MFSFLHQDSAFPQNTVLSLFVLEKKFIDNYKEKITCFECCLLICVYAVFTVFLLFVCFLYSFKICECQKKFFKCKCCKCDKRVKKRCKTIIMKRDIFMKYGLECIYHILILKFFVTEEISTKLEQKSDSNPNI